MTDQSPARATEGRWMVRVEDGCTFPFNEPSTRERYGGRPRFLEICYDDAAFIPQFPLDITRALYTASKDGKDWVLSPIGKEIFGMDDRARQAFEQDSPESREVLAERKARLTELANGDPNPLAYALRQLCFNPNSDDPRFTERSNFGHLAKRDRDRVEREAIEGILSLLPGNLVRIMDLVCYLAEKNPKHYPIRDFFWTYAYRHIVAEGWRPGLPQGMVPRPPAISQEPPKSAAKKGRGRPRLSDEERDLAKKLVKAHREGHVSFHDCAERFCESLTQILRKKWNRGPCEKFDNEQLETEVKRLWESARKKKLA